MKKYRVDVVMSFWQTIEVEAENAEDAANIAYPLFDATKPMTQGEGEVMHVEETDKLTGDAK